MVKSTKKLSVIKPVIIIGSDHAGYKTKQVITKFLTKKGYTLVDVGNFKQDERVDYPDYAREVAKLVAKDKQGNTKGVLVCGTGTGMAIAANKTAGIRAAFAFDKYSAQMARLHNDANIIALRGRKFSAQKAAQLAQLFLTTSFSEEPRHKQRINKIKKLETKQ